MAKLIPILSFDRQSIRGYRFWCPACRELHPLYVAGPPPLWWFDGNMDSPTFSPSLRMLGGNGCHLTIGQGVIYYCNDSGHEFRNKSVPMVDYDFERRYPVSVLHTINGRPVEFRHPPSDGGIFSQVTSAPPPMTGGPASLTDPAVLQIDQEISAGEKLIAEKVKQLEAKGVPAQKIHRDECGVVGNVGAVGDLGSNAHG
jgi:hypothetical protein